MHKWSREYQESIRLYTAIYGYAVCPVCNMTNFRSFWFGISLGDVTIVPAPGRNAWFSSRRQDRVATLHAEKQGFTEGEWKKTERISRQSDNGWRISLFRWFMNFLIWFLHVNYEEDFLAMFDYWRVSCYGLQVNVPRMMYPGLWISRLAQDKR